MKKKQSVPEEPAEVRLENLVKFGFPIAQKRAVLLSDARVLLACLQFAIYVALEPLSELTCFIHSVLGEYW